MSQARKRAKSNRQRPKEAAKKAKWAKSGEAGRAGFCILRTKEKAAWEYSFFGLGKREGIAAMACPAIWGRGEAEAYLLALPSWCGCIDPKYPGLFLKAIDLPIRMGKLKIWRFPCPKPHGR
jgi:hypothetical protein